jgi:serine/threonine protein kinase
MADLTGQTLGKYQILERLGRGGMADVYKGYQPGLDRYVAVKILHSHLSEDPDFITRFRREAQSVAELHHPYIVQVFDFDVQGDNYYMVMEYIANGRTLKQLLQELAGQAERLPIEQTIGIVLNLADALAYAHSVGMIHRDIKPANVLLPALDRPVLGDFGIARLMGETGLTSSGAMIGTPAYMSPEQGRGERGDARSDIYALGIVLYEMVTGKPPYDADTPYAIILKHINDPLTPPHVILGSVPESIERIILKCLAKDAADRFATMVELREALRGAQSTIGAQKTPTTSEVIAPTVQAVKPQPAAALSTASSDIPAKRSVPRAVWLIGAVVILLVIGALIVPNMLSSPKPASSTSTPINSALITNTPVIIPTAVPTRVKSTEVLPTASLSEAAKAIAAGYEKLFSGDTDAAYDQFQQALVVEPNNPHALVGRATAEVIRYGDMKAAADDLDLAAKSIPNDPFLQYGRGLLHARADDYSDVDAADLEFTQAIKSCANNTALCVAAHYERADLRTWSLDDFAGALDDMNQAIELYADKPGADYLYDRRAYIHFHGLGDTVEAIADLKTAYQISKSAYYLEEAAGFAARAQLYGLAIDLYNRLLQDQAGDPHYLAGRGYVEWRAGNPNRARQTVDRTLQLAPDLLEAHYLKGLLLLDAGQPKDALAEFKPISTLTDTDALDNMAQPFLNTDFGHEIFYDMARTAEASGDHVAAQKYIAQSLERNDGWPRPYILRAQIFKEQGDLAGARENYLKALDLVDDKDKLKEFITKALADLTQ